MKILILAIGKCKKGSPEYALIEEYQKRLSWNLIIKEKDNDTQKKEAEFLLENIQRGAKVVVLDERGENISSLAFASKIRNWQNEGVSEICFLIGGADGHTEIVRKQADLLLSFGKLTMPHMLIRAVLAEQIYRAQTILDGHPYHRE
ncbi:MAG: 23S rRNA (pseudouridine(1915)-N(3))-methyltransferase RlmH [Alphaproteobacteria bacterium]|nr:23S rRNA (pseudouridine(1915)-N(3))-methyltransferase RlmH [Alphaproteobacteria bacterium]